MLECRGVSRIFSRGGGFSKKFRKFGRLFFEKTGKIFLKKTGKKPILGTLWKILTKKTFGARSPSKIASASLNPPMVECIGKWLKRSKYQSCTHRGVCIFMLIFYRACIMCILPSWTFLGVSCFFCLCLHSAVLPLSKSFSMLNEWFAK